MNEGPVEPRKLAVLVFAVHYSTGQPAQPNQAATNSFGLRGQGRLLIDEGHLTFQGERNGFKLGGPPRFALAAVANVDFNAETGAFLLRTLDSDDFVVFWTTSREDAQAIWGLLPHEKTAEFLAEQQKHERFVQNMSELGERALVAPTLIALNVAMFIVMLIAGADIMRPQSELLIRFGSNEGPRTWGGEQWRLLSSAFLHSGVLHLVLNMFALYQGGRLVERLFGSGRFVLLYLLSALAGSVASGWWHPYGNSVGASGAIFGVFGALLAFFAVRRADFPHQVWKSVGSTALWFCGISLAIGIASPMIDNAAHIGGLLAGLLMGLVLARPLEIGARKSPQGLRLLAAALVVLLPLTLMAHSLMAADGSRAAGLRFWRSLETFQAIDARLTVQASQLLNPGPNVRVNRIELAGRLQNEILLPWRAAAREFSAQPPLPADGSRVVRLQGVFSEYLRAKDQALALRVQALQQGDASSDAQADAAQRRVTELVNRWVAIINEGT